MTAGRFYRDPLRHTTIFFAVVNCKEIRNYELQYTVFMPIMLSALFSFDLQGQLLLN